MAKRRLFIKLLILVLIVVTVILTAEIWLPVPGTFLLVNDNIQKADCIVPLVGEAYIRFRKVAELCINGYVKNIVVSLLDTRERKFGDYDFRLLLIASKDISEKEFALMALRYYGIAPNNVYITDKEVSSTYEEAVATKRLMAAKGFKSLIVVTSTYHMRRALMIFRLVFGNTDIKIYNCTARKEIYNPNRWWLKERDVKNVIQEYIAIIYNLFYHFVLNNTRTSFDST